MPTGTLLLIDDEARLRQLLAQVLELEGYVVLQAPDAHRGLALLAAHTAEVLVVLSDVKLPDGHGVELLPRFRALAPLAEVVLLTAFGTIPDGVKAMKLGAFDYLTKGDFEQQLVVVVEARRRKGAPPAARGRAGKARGPAPQLREHDWGGTGAAARPAPGPAGGAHRQHRAA
jgi:two-component system NtrC family response regulator